MATSVPQSPETPAVNMIRCALDRLFGPKAPPIRLGPGPYFAEELQRQVNAFRRKSGLPPVRLDVHLCRDAQATAERLARGFDVEGDRILIAVGLDTAAEVAGAWMSRSADGPKLLSPRHTDAGFGFATAIDGRTRYWVGIFAAPSEG